MAANQLAEKSVAAHRASLKRKANKNKAKTLLIVALSPIASRVSCFKTLNCSTFDRHANKIVGIVAKPAIT